MRVTERFHYILMFITLAVMLASAALIPFINVNSDMTKYLPDDSSMKQGLDVMQTNFDMASFSLPDVRVMAKDLSVDERIQMEVQLDQMHDVLSVETRESVDGRYTLFELQTPDSINMISMSREIRNMFSEQDVVVETAQDGATPPISVIVIAALLVIILLMVMGQSWLEPVIFLINVGVAVLINAGTNAFLPSVSITTNYIGSILQLVLSLDFSIVLMNRFRQEIAPDCTPLTSMNRAIKRATRPILSSALTTIVGLLMLCFMRLKIGMDMGIVLAKGVVCSLVCTFTLLPSLLLLFRTGIEKTAKKSIVLPVDRLGRFATRHKMSIVLVALGVLALAWWLSRKTPIFFSNKNESRIEKIFPMPNTFLLIYNPLDEQGVIRMADCLEQDSCVQTVVSYPSLLKKQFVAEDATAYISTLATKFADYVPDNMDQSLDLLSNETMRIVYYLRSQQGDTIRLTFAEMMQFLANECADNPLFEAYIPEDVRAQMGLLRLMLEPEDEEEPSQVPLGELKTEVQKSAVDVDQNSSKIAQEEFAEESRGEEFVEERHGGEIVEEERSEAGEDFNPLDERLLVAGFVRQLYAKNPAEDIAYLAHIMDKTQLQKEMSAREISDFVGSTSSQTKMVFSMSKSGKTMTPYQYVHFLLDDLFLRPSLQSFVSEEQKAGLTQVGKMMDYAMSDAMLKPNELAEALMAYGVKNMTTQRVIAIAYPNYAQPEQSMQGGLALRVGGDVSELRLGVDSDAQQMSELRLHRENELAMKQYTLAPISTLVPKQSAMLPPRVNRLTLQRVKALTASHRQATEPMKPAAKSAEERRAERFMNAMNSTKRLSPTDMTQIFQQLGYPINLSQAELMVAFYGCMHYYDEEMTMSTEEILDYIGDTLMLDERLQPYFPSEMLEGVRTAREGLGDAVSMLSHDSVGLFVVMTNLPDESPATYAFVDTLHLLGGENLPSGYHILGQSAMYSEMRNGFSSEMTLVTLLTIAAIFLIVVFSFRSVVIPIFLITTVLSAVFINVIFSGLISGGMLYLAYLIVQSILMGATIDYGILFANYYRENRKTLPKYEAARAAYQGSIRTIMTSGAIMVAAPGVMSLLVEDVAISSIVGCLAIGALVAILLILFVLPAVLVALDRWVV